MNPLKRIINYNKNNNKLLCVTVQIIPENRIFNFSSFMISLDFTHVGLMAKGSLMAREMHIFTITDHDYDYLLL